MKRNIGYHTRAYGNNTIKLTGGSFGGQIDSETIERLVNSQFTVTIKNSGTAVFVDGSGREVNLYLSVDASDTEIGKKAISEWTKERCRRQAEQELKDQIEAEHIDRLMAGLSHDEIVRRLEG